MDANTINTHKKYTMTLLKASLVSSQESTKDDSPNRRRGRSRSHRRKNISRDKVKSLSPNSTKSRVKMKSRNLELTKRRRIVLPTAELKIGNIKVSRVLNSRKYEHNHKSMDKNREYLERLLNRNMNVCYMTNLRDCIDKLKATYKCEQHQCPSLQERLHKHRLLHHPEYFPPSMVSCSQGNQAQTKITLADLGNVTISIETRPMSTSTPKDGLTGNGNFMNDDDLEKYNLEIEEELKTWLAKIPFHPNETNDDIEAKYESIRRLKNEIQILKKESKNIGSEGKTKELIDQCLDELQIWYPGPKRDQQTFKEGLRENLNERIKSINRKFFKETTSNQRKFVDGNINNDKDGRANIRNASKSFDHNFMDDQNLLPVSNTVNDKYYNDEVRNRMKNYQRSGLDGNVTNSSKSNKTIDNYGELKKGPTATKVKEYYSTPRRESVGNSNAGQDPNIFKVIPTDGYNEFESSTNKINSNTRKSKLDYVENNLPANKNYNYNGNNKNERPPETYSGNKNKQNDNYEHDRLDSNYDSENNDKKGNDDTLNKTKIKAKPKELSKTKKDKEINYYSDSDMSLNQFQMLNNANIFNKEKNHRQNPVENNKHCLSSESDLKVRYYRKTKHKNGITYSEPNMTCTLKSEDLCACTGEKNKPKNKKARCGPKKVDMEQEIAEWLRSSTIIKNDALLGKKEVIDSLVLHLGPYINKPAEKLNKASVKARIVSIFKELGICTAPSGSVKNYFDKISEDLANRLIGIKSRLECTGGKNWKCGIIARKPFKYLEEVVIGPNEVFRKDLKHDFMEIIKECLSNTALAGNIDVIEEISDELIEKVELIRRDIKESVTRNIRDILNEQDILDKDVIVNITSCILRGAKEKITFINNINNRTNFNTVLSVQHVRSGVLSIYTSEHEIGHTFNPNPKTIDRFKLNEGEKAYFDFLYNYVYEWIQRIKLNSFGIENRQVTDLMVNELVEEIFDYMKWEQWEASTTAEKLSCLSFYIFKWLLKFNIFDDFQNAEPHVHELIRELRQTETPHFNTQRNDCVNSKSESSVVSDSSSWSNSFVQKNEDSKNILENAISMWLRELPSDIYKPNGKHNEHIKKIANKIQPKLNKKTDDSVTKAVKEWLKKILKVKAKKKIDTLSESLVEKIKQQCNSSNSALPDNSKAKKIQETSPETINDTEEEIDATMTKIIMKYIEHNWETDDVLTKRTYAQILISVLLKLCPKKQIELIPSDLLSAESLCRQFEYITDVSEWIKNLPINSSFNTIGNKNRINFVIKLAEEISDIEKQQKNSPISFNDHLKGTVHQLMEQLPILPEGKENIHLLIDQLMKKTGARSTKIPLTISENQDLNIPDIIEQYVKTNRKETVNEELTLELWSACMLKEVKKILTKINNSDPNHLKNGATIKLPPEDELVKRFNSQLEYAHEISDWIKNLPIIRPLEAVNISALADKLVAHDIKILNDSDLKNYIEQWINNSPLDTQRSINVALLIKQLINRKNKLSKKSDRHQTGDEKKKTAKSSKLFKSELTKTCKYENPGYMLVKVIENWCQNLPLEETDDVVKKLKCDYIADKLYQKISELNDNPRYYNNIILYKASLADEIDNQLSTQTNLIKTNRDNLKTELLDSVQEARLLINDMAAGNSYKQKLEDKIEDFFPKPVASVLEDPGFNLYKKYLSDFFILDNFDVANDVMSQKYEEDMMNKVKKYATYAIEPNDFSLIKDQIYNEIYESLYKISLPDKLSLTDDVKEIKTEIVINEWFNELPIAKPKDAKEILYTAQMIAFLAKRLCRMEKEKKSNKIMNSEIIKWLSKVPLENDQADLASNYSQSLLERLKKLHKSQKYIKLSDKKSKNSRTQFIPSNHSNYIQSNEDNSNILPSPNPTIKPVRKSGDILIDIIDTWCDDISFPKDIASAEAKKLKKHLSRKLIMKISELNSDPNIFNEDIVYNHLLSQEIDKLLQIISKNGDLNQSKDAMKNELLLKINSVKPLIIEERSRHEYMKDLEEVFNSIITDVPKVPNSEHEALYAKTREEIIDNFVEYLYGHEDCTSKKNYKEKVIEAFEQFYSKFMRDSSGRHLESLKHANHIICELSKIPSPNDRAMEEQIQESRIKREVGNFFDTVSAPKPHVEKNIVRNMLKNSLAAELHDLERTSGYNRETREKMKKSIERVLKKLGTTVKNSKIDDFLNKLQQSENKRNAQPLKKNAYYETVNTNELNQFRSPSKSLPTGNPQGPPLRDSIIVESFESGSYPVLQSLNVNNSENHKKSNSLGVVSKQSADMPKAIKSNDSTVLELIMMENSKVSNPPADYNSVLNLGETPDTGQSENDPNVETINSDTTQLSTSSVSSKSSPTQNLNNSVNKNSLQLPQSPLDQLTSPDSSTKQFSQQSSSSTANLALTSDTQYPKAPESSLAGQRKSMQDTGVQYSTPIADANSSTKSTDATSEASKSDPKSKNRSISVPVDDKCFCDTYPPLLYRRLLCAIPIPVLEYCDSCDDLTPCYRPLGKPFIF